MMPSIHATPLKHQHCFSLYAVPFYSQTKRNCVHEQKKRFQSHLTCSNDVGEINQCFVRCSQKSWKLENMLADNFGLVLRCILYCITFYIRSHYPLFTGPSLCSDTTFLYFIY